MKPARPELVALPLFVELLRRADISEREAKVYGAIAAYQHLGYQPTYADVAVLTGDTTSDQRRTRERVKRLEDAGLLRRVATVYGRGAAGSSRFQLLGPVLPEPKSIAC